MKLVSINRINELWNDGVILSLAKKIDKTKILTTEEQVMANTSNENVASAPVVKLLINDLAQQPEFVYDATGKITGYKTQAGADTVFPFSGTLITQEFSKNITTNGYQIPQTVTINGIIYKYVGVKSLTLNSTLISGGGYTISASETGFVSINNPATSAVLKGIALYSIN